MTCHLLKHLNSVLYFLDINECDTIQGACRGEMKCFNHYGGYLCLPRSAYVVTAPEPSSQSEPSVPVETSEAFNPCTVGYRAQGDTCVGELFKGRYRKSYSYGFILKMCISMVY